MPNLPELRGNTALDSSALVEYFRGTATGAVLRKYFETIDATESTTISLLALAETFYVLCRLKGPELAIAKLEEFLTSGVEVSNSIELGFQTGKLKCERAISLSDCSCLAAAKLNGAKAVFAFKEDELLREMKRRRFDVEVVFLDDLKPRHGI